MPHRKPHPIINLLLVVLPLLCILFRLTPEMAEVYARRVYPYVSSLQSLVTGWVSFSVSDVGYLLLIATGLYWVFLLLFSKQRRRQALRSLLTATVMLYSLFYLLWGINYSRPDFFTRNHLQKTATDTIAFKSYCLTYVDRLNRSFTERDSSPDPTKLATGIKNSYQLLSQRFTIYTPRVWPTVKPLLLGRLFAGMGVNGYYGVLGGEPSVNPLIFPTDYPAAFAHEMAHALGVSSEAEANFWAYRVCTHTTDSSLHFYGYYSVLRYLLRDAAILVSTDFAGQLTRSIDHRILELYRQSQAHYQSLYWESAGNAQNRVYHSFLRSQGVKAGIADYSLVVSYLLAADDLK